MRLLDTRTGRFVEFYDIANVRYAILSHTWDPLGEQTHQDVKGIQERLVVELEPPLLTGSSIQAKVGHNFSTSPRDQHSASGIGLTFQPIPGFWSDSKLSQKIWKACEIARADGYGYLWIDSCCIDKTSSSELSEAINSMYAWYGGAAICYAALTDVPHEDIPDSKGSAFRRSRWFKRGWTLQELIAPRRLVFLSSDWQTIGSKSSMAELVEQITRINGDVLTNELSLDCISVAKRMSWAADPETTRVEDRAYSLLGIFDLNMPTLYGEGERAFRRLQEEILRRIPDQTLFALGVDPTRPRLPRYEDVARPRYIVEVSRNETLFSSSPSSFILADTIDTTYEVGYLHLLGLAQIPPLDYNPSPYGIRASFPVISLQRCFHFGTLATSDKSSIFDWYLVILRCYSSSRDPPDLGPHLLARICRIAPSPSSSVDIVTVGTIRRESSSPQTQRNVRTAARESEYTTFTMSADDLERLHRHIQVRTVYIPHPDRAPPAPPPPLDRGLALRPLKLVLSPYSSAVLHAAGYDVDFRQPGRTSPSSLPWTHSLVLRRRDCVLQLNVDQVPRLPDPFLSAAVWRFTAGDAESHRFPLSTSREPRPHDCVWYSFGGGFPVFGLQKDTEAPYGEGGGGGVVFRLELEEAAPSDGSYYLHVDVEEPDWYVAMDGNYIAFKVRELVEACSQTSESSEPAEFT